MKRSEIKRLDIEFSLKVRARGKCEKCGKQPPAVRLNCAHIFSRRYLHLRWNERNALCLCAKCHFWAHDEPVNFALWLQEYIGQKEIAYLIKERNNLEKVK
jgi:hypothetical protein